MEEILGFVVPANLSVFSLLLPATKRGYANNPSECVGSLNTVVYMNAMDKPG